MAGAGQRHVEQAQVFALAVGVGLGKLDGIGLQHQLALTRRAGHCDKGRARPADGAKAAGKGQEHQRVLQALGLVHRHQLDQVGIALQAHDLLVAGVRPAVDLTGQPADQALLTLDLGAGGLQQFGQVQHVGQAALAAVVSDNDASRARRLSRGRGAGQPACRQIEPVQGLAQHAEHTLVLPDAVQLAQQLAAGIKRLVIAGQVQQLGHRQADQPGGQRGACQPGVERRSHRPQPAQQVVGLVAVEHRVFVRQVDRRHLAAAQRLPHGGGLTAGAHQHGDVGGAQAAEVSRVRAGKPGLGIVEQGHDLLGTALGKPAQTAVAIAQLGVQHQAQRRNRPGSADQALRATARGDRDEGQQRLGGVGACIRIRIRIHTHTHIRNGAEHERPRALPQFGLLKHLVHGRHQSGGRAVVGAQQVVAAGCGAAHRQVAVDVGAAKAVDRLLGVADQQQGAGAAVVADAVEPVEDAHLHRRGVLKLVHQRHRVLGQDAVAQAQRRLAVGLGVQRLVEPVQQVGKAEAAGLLLEHRQPGADTGRRMQAQAGAQRRQRVQRPQQLGQGLEVIGHLLDPGTGFEGLVQAGGCQAGGAGLEVGRFGVIPFGPGRQRGQPGVVVTRRELALVERAGLEGELLVQPLAHRGGALRPAAFERGNVARPLGAQALDQRLQRALAGIRGQHLRQQGLGVASQRIDIAPDRQRGVPGRARQRVELGAPVVACGLGQQRGLVAGELFIEQAAGVERMLAQHALAPGVDGVHRRVVHALGRHRKTPGCGLARRAGWVVGQQAGQQAVVRGGLGLAAKDAGGLQQAGTDAVGQLAGGGPGEGHHQDLGRLQRPLEPRLAAVAQHQAQVERGNRPGLAGAGTGLDQAAAPKREAQRVQDFSHGGGLLRPDRRGWGRRRGRGGQRSRLTLRHRTG